MRSASSARRRPSGAVAVGGYFAYKQWWDGGTVEAAGPDDGEMSDAEAELFATGLAEELFSELARRTPARIRSTPSRCRRGSRSGRSALGRPSFGGPSVRQPVARRCELAGPRMPAPRRRPAPRPHHDAPDMPQPRPRVEHEPSGHGEHSGPSGPSATTRPADLFSDPELESVRTQLRDRITKLALPDGTDPADATKLRADLEGLLERFRAYPGQSVDDAVASLRYEFEDRVRDFAQDQRIEALIEEQNKPDMPADKPTEMPGEMPAGDMPADKPAETPSGTPAAGGLADVFDESPPPPTPENTGIVPPHLQGGTSTPTQDDPPPAPTTEPMTSRRRRRLRRPPTQRHRHRRPTPLRRWTRTCSEPEQWRKPLLPRAVRSAHRRRSDVRAGAGRRRHARRPAGHRGHGARDTCN